MTTELHPLGFFLPENTRLLMLGSFPPPKARWSMDFYYPNIQNDMWRILGLIFYGNKDAFLRDKKAFSEEKAKAFCREKGIGIGDTAMEVIRLKANASDKFLEVVRPIDPQKVPDTGMRGDRGNRTESDGYPPLRIARHGGAESGLLVGIFLYGKDDEAVPHALIL